jgi:formate hydrogenlyase transcriptional activator
MFEPAGKEMANEAVAPFKWTAHLNSHSGEHPDRAAFIVARAGVNGSVRRLIANLSARLATIDTGEIDDALIALREASEELTRLRDGADQDNVRTRRSAAAPRLSRPVVSDSAAVRRALSQVEQVASTPSTVLLLGETGVGKELFAQAIHELSARQNRRMIRVSCAAIPSSLIESELFGHERGAFTGALMRQIGRFEFANHSTLFLDEIGELSPEVQVKLLRVLEQRVIERLGSTQPIDIDVRIIAATHRNLEKAVAEGRFREDLFYRLNVFPIVIPPLRERAEDIPGLVWQFVDECSKKLGKPVESIPQQSMQRLQRYAWPGNVRELRNVIERAVIVADSPRLTVSLPGTGGAGPRLQILTLDEVQIAHIRETLQSTGWRVRGPGGAAERLGVKPTTLESRMAKFGLTRQQM